uniref:Uncharacterized protein n=1 Tax=Anopheles culicifacies TaxID=139723 RepID=A0A182MTJ7_9DIPT
MSAKRMRKTGQIYKIIKANNAQLEAELFGESSSFGANNIPVATTYEDLEQISNHSFDEDIEEEEEEITDWLISDEFDNIESNDNDANDEVESSLDNVQEPTDEEEPFEEVIKQWALKTYQTHQAINGLLAILRARTNYTLPKDARTLLGTQQSGKDIVPIEGGEFWFPGVRSVLNRHFRNVQPNVSSFSLNLSFDGLPLNKSTRKQFWPILMSIQELPEVPVLMVGNFYGFTKPKSVEQYLRPLVSELNEMIQNGIVIADKLIQVRVRAIVADSPARAFIKAGTSCRAGVALMDLPTINPAGRGTPCADPVAGTSCRAGVALVDLPTTDPAGRGTPCADPVAGTSCRAGVALMDLLTINPAGRGTPCADPVAGTSCRAGVALMDLPTNDPAGLETPCAVLLAGTT